SAQRPAPNIAPIVLPKIPSTLIEECHGLCTTCWLKHERSMMVFLYLHFATDVPKWRSFVPLQRLGRSSIDFSMRGEGFPALDLRWRLAGSFCRLPFLKSEFAVPSFEGPHFRSVP